MLGGSTGPLPSPMLRRSHLTFRRLRSFIMVTFGFSRSEARAFIILLPLMFLIVFSRPTYRAIFPIGHRDLFADAKQLDSLLATLKWSEADSVKTHFKNPFRFNPNKVTATEMDSLGIPLQLATRIERYRSKGGTFRTPADLQKIYGFDSSLFVRLKPFIVLPEKIKHQERRPLQAGVSTPHHVFSARPAKENFDLNVADTATLDGVYGIGPTLAKRIVLYRERLGGFIREEQLYEVWGLDSAVVARTLERATIADDFVPLRIKINSATEAELAGHPYIKAKTARVIVTYRFQHGNFSSIEHLGQTIFFDPKNFERIKPYLTLE
jgi:competence protein ComEA